MATRSENGELGETRNVSMLRLGAIAGVIGVVAQIWLAGLHAGTVDPNDSVRVFQQYAASGIWTLVHVGQYAGTFLIALSLLTVTRAMDRETGVAGTFRSMAAIAITTVIAIFAVQMAVDGVALRETILAWTVAAPADKAAAFLVADGVRWIEKGLSAFFHLNNGTALVALGIAVVTGRTFARWIGAFGILGGLGTIAGGLIGAQTGFSPQSASILGPSTLVAAVFLFALGASMWRHSLRPTDAAVPAAVSTAPGA